MARVLAYNRLTCREYEWNLCDVFVRQPISLACLFIWETQTELSVFLCVCHANRQANEIICLAKTSNYYSKVRFKRQEIMNNKKLLLWF